MQATLQKGTQEIGLKLQRWVSLHSSDMCPGVVRTSCVVHIPRGHGYERRLTQFELTTSLQHRVGAHSRGF